MRIALAQTNPTIGDIAGNTQQIHRSILESAEQGCQLVIFPELAVIGYPPKDLLLKSSVVKQCVEAVEQLARMCTDTAAIIGYPCPSESARGRTLVNAAALCRSGSIDHCYVKSLLPTYDVFDEQRYFEPGSVAEPVDLGGQKLGVSICEDLWNDAELFDRRRYHVEPVKTMVDLGATLFINCSASPFVMGKHEFRLRLFAHTAKRFALPLLYCNQVGGNDELVFDGNSCAFDAQGNLIAQAKDFKEDLLVFDLPQDLSAANKDGDRNSTGAQSNLPLNRMETPETGIVSVYHALVLGVRDYCRKCGFETIVLGLSGGIDSAVTAALCVAAIGSKKVRGVSMPSRYSSKSSITDATELAKRLGIDFRIISIEKAHLAFENMLAPHFKGAEPDVSEENVQARIRGVILMALSNKFNSLLVTTGNKSELAVGYCTLYGDMAGGLGVLSDVPKTMVWQLARWINDTSPLRQHFNGAIIPENSIVKPPSAELRPDQTDQDSLPSYEILDQIIERYVEREQSVDKIVDEMNFDPKVVLRMVRLIDLNEYKRKQAAPGLKVTGRAFGFGRRMPIAQCREVHMTHSM